MYNLKIIIRNFDKNEMRRSHSFEVQNRINFMRYRSHNYCFLRMEMKIAVAYRQGNIGEAALM
ncbi:MAG TPA: hypothetical protein DCM44_02075 [Pantoea sp.]|nr:hypothetical protein A6J33_000815 [Pantoea sp. FDAARGOS_194]HAK33719.1 hypothetical protein [Pantoea sp.]